MKTSTPIVLTLVSLLWILPLDAAKSADGRIVRLMFPDGHASERVRPDRQDKEFDGRPAKISGELHFSRRGGLNVDGWTIVIDGLTSIFPSVGGDRMPSPSSLNGRHVTVLGVQQTRKTIQARLMIVQGLELNAMGARQSPPQAWELPANTGEPVGELTEATPR